MIARSIPDMFNAYTTETKSTKRKPGEMSDAEIKSKLCFDVKGGCKECGVLDACKYGAEAVRRGIRQ